MNQIGFALFAGTALALLFAFHYAESQSAAAIRALAIRSGFHYLGDALPRSLTLYRTPIGVGRGSWRRTVIAVEGGSDLSLLLNPEMTIDSAGQWKILYRQRPSISLRIAGLMPPEELEPYLNSVATDARPRGNAL